MRYKVEFENNLPVRAIPVPQTPRSENRAEFDLENGKTIIKFLYVEAESKENAVLEARNIIENIFRF